MKSYMGMFDNFVQHLDDPDLVTVQQYPLEKGASSKRGFARSMTGRCIRKSGLENAGRPERLHHRAVKLWGRLPAQ